MSSFAEKMFCLNEKNRFVICRQATDMRKGPNMLCGVIRSYGLDPGNGDVYVFIGSNRHIIKLLVWENGGYAVYYKRLEAGCISPKVFHRDGGGFRVLSWDDLVLFMMGISPTVKRRKRYIKGENAPMSEDAERDGEKSGIASKKRTGNVWLSR